MVTINIPNKKILSLSIIITLSIAAGFVIAYNYPVNDPMVMGHSLGEIQKCLDGQILKSNATGEWECSTLSSLTGPVTGSVIGGGLVNTNLNSCTSWGSAYCIYPANIACPTGSTKRPAEYVDGHVFCIKD